MNVIRVILAVIIGLVVGSSVNMGIVMVGPMIIPPPPGVDVSTTESLTATIHLFEVKHFISPFLAHALGTLTGALVAFFVANNHQLKICYSIGLFSLAGGIAASMMIPAPYWFIALDLLVAYMPMAWLAIQMARRIRPQNEVGEP